MKRPYAIALALSLVLIAAGCGGAETAKTSPPAQSPGAGGVRETDIIGPWIVHGQPEAQYYLKFDYVGAFGMKKAGVFTGGAYTLSGDYVILTDAGGNRFKLKYVKGGGAMQDRLEGDVVWTRS